MLDPFRNRNKHRHTVCHKVLKGHLQKCLSNTHTHIHTHQHTYGATSPTLSIYAQLSPDHHPSPWVEVCVWACVRISVYVGALTPTSSSNLLFCSPPQPQPVSWA